MWQEALGAGCFGSPLISAQSQVETGAAKRTVREPGVGVISSARWSEIAGSRAIAFILAIRLKNGLSDSKSLPFAKLRGCRKASATVQGLEVLGEGRLQQMQVLLRKVQELLYGILPPDLVNASPVMPEQVALNEVPIPAGGSSICDPVSNRSRLHRGLSGGRSRARASCPNHGCGRHGRGCHPSSRHGSAVHHG